MPLPERWGQAPGPPFKAARTSFRPRRHDELRSAKNNDVIHDFSAAGIGFSRSDRGLMLFLGFDGPIQNNPAAVDPGIEIAPRKKRIFGKNLIKLVLNLEV